ncbi:autotransporter assembly complex protein TamA [Cognatiyoonia koreensis]|uniref:autotransporter assembly complex protein TamA n=1 Tax=Cognatiyoonia koreensis TaxID=364200 RepID=UPI001F60D1D4|nr:autotransporter assembly complex family protein [Cognatiyoonia koreensis]
MAGLLLASGPLAAQSISLEIGDAGDGLRGDIEAASLTLGLEEQEEVAPQDIVAAARADYRRILTALYSAGYYGGTVSIRINGREAADIAPLDAPRQISAVVIDVDRGPRFDFGRVGVAPLPPNTTLPDRFATGEPARANVIRESVSTGVNAWRDIGYAKARPADQTIVARHPQRELDVNVTLAPGQQLTFGPLTINGNEDVRTSAIARIAGFPTGEIYDPDAITTVERRLRKTGAFDSVALTEADEIGPNATLPFTLQIVESKPRRFGFGLELSSIEGLLVSAFWMHRNAFGGAERFRVEGEVSGIGGETGGIDYKIATSLNIPAVYGPKTDFLATATLSRLDEPEFLLDSIATEASLTRLIRDDLTANVGIGLLAAREETALGTREYILLTAPLGFELERRNDVTNPTSGYYVELDATPFLSLDGAGDGGRIYADARAYASFGTDDRFTIAARGQIGSVIGVDALTAPADFLFYSGGGGTVRGQPYQSLGLETADNGGVIQTGGLSFAGAQLEARVGVTENIGVVGFYDYGFVGSTATPLEDGEWHAGTGIGVRYNTGIGPIRLDIGTPANGDDAFGSVQVYIGIGQAF